MYESLVAFGGYCNALNMLEDKNAVDGLFNEMINSWTLKKGKADDKKKKDKKKSKKSSFGKDKGKKDWLINYFLNI